MLGRGKKEEEIMPLYEYECKKCGERFVILEGKEEKRCPRCRSKRLERRFSKFSVEFRGDGFYATDYKRK